MACYTQILISMKESFIVKCSFLWSTLEHQSSGGWLHRRTAVSLALCEGVSAVHGSNMHQSA